MIRNQHPPALMASAAIGSYAAGLAATAALEQFGFSSAYVAGFVLTGMALGISWLLVHFGIVAPMRHAQAAIGADTAALPQAELRDHKIIGPLIERVLKATHGVLQTVRAVSRIIEKNSIALAETSHRASALNAGIKALASKGAEIAASSHAIAATSAHVSSSASRAAQSARRAQDDSRSGQQALQETIAEMRNMASRTQTASASIAKLQGSSIKIEEIVKVIGEIADQINLLALNAAIEAARAGESGRGFAVVADEVRKLAERTSKSTTEISTMVDAIQTRTDAAVREMQDVVVKVGQGQDLAGQAGAKITEIREHAAHVASSFSDITVALREQDLASQEIARNVENIASIADENLAVAESMASSVEHLNGIAGQVDATVSVFRV